MKKVKYYEKKFYFGASNVSAAIKYAKKIGLHVISCDQNKKVPDLNTQMKIT